MAARASPIELGTRPGESAAASKAKGKEVAEAEDMQPARLNREEYDQEDWHPELRLPATGDRFPGVTGERLAPYLQLATDEAIVRSASRLPTASSPRELAEMLDQHANAYLGRESSASAERSASPQRLFILGEVHRTIADLYQALLGITSSGKGTVLLIEMPSQKQADKVHKAGKRYLRKRAKHVDMSKQVGELVSNNKMEGHWTALGALAEAAGIKVRTFDPLYGSGKDILAREEAQRESIAAALAEAHGRTVVVLCGTFHVGPLHEFFTREEFGTDIKVAAAAHVPADDRLQGVPAHLRERFSYVMSHPDVLAWKPTDELNTSEIQLDALLASRGIEYPVVERRSLMKFFRSRRSGAGTSSNDA